MIKQNKSLLRLATLFITVSVIVLSTAINVQAEYLNESQQLPSKQQASADKELEELGLYIDGLVSASINDLDPPGVIVSVVLGDEEFTKGYGVANSETGELNDENTLFRVGSISKLFVWLSAHMLADQGKLDLNAPLNNYLDGFAIPDAFSRQITMRDLMSHRPGFEDRLKEFVDSNRDITLKEAVMNNIPARVAPPGERTSYSNSGTNLAAYIVEEVSGISYYEFVKQYILDPVGLRSTTLRDPGIGRNPLALEQRFAKPHKIENGVPVVANYMAIRPQEPVGAAAMDAKDAAKFMRLLLNNTQYEGGRLLSRENWERIKFPSFKDAEGGDDMGWGFMLNDVDGYSTIGHGGATQFLSWLFVVPEIKMGVFVSSNMNSDDSRGEAIAWSIVRRVTGTGSITDFLMLKGDLDAANNIAGNYLDNRRPFTGGATLIALASDIKIKATEDGYLVFPGEEEVLYAPLNSTIWVNKYGERLRIVKDSAGNVLRLHSSLGSTTLERISLISTRLALAIGFGGVFLLSFTSLMGTYYRYGRSLNIPPIGKKMAWVNTAVVITWLTFFVFLALGFVGLVNLDITKIDESTFPPFTLKIAFGLTVLVCIATLIQLASLVIVWRRSGWTLWRRIHYTIFALFSAFGVYLLYHWNLIAGSIYGL